MKGQHVICLCHFHDRGAAAEGFVTIEIAGHDLRNDNLLQRISEERIDQVEGNCAAANYRARGYRPPQDVGACKSPDREQARYHGHQHTHAGGPE